MIYAIWLYAICYMLYVICYMLYVMCYMSFVFAFFNLNWVEKSSKRGPKRGPKRSLKGVEVKLQGGPKPDDFIYP